MISSFGFVCCILHLGIDVNEDMCEDNKQYESEDVEQKANGPQVVNFLKAVTNISVEEGSVPGMGS